MTVAAFFVPRAAGLRHCGLTAGTEVQRGLVDGGRLHGQWEMLILVPRDAVPFRDIPFLSAAEST